MKFLITFISLFAINVFAIESYYASIKPVTLTLSQVAIQLEPSDESYITRVPGTNFSSTNIVATGFVGDVLCLSWPYTTNVVVIQQSTDLINWTDIRVRHIGTTNWFVRPTDVNKSFRMRTEYNSTMQMVEVSSMSQNIQLITQMAQKKVPAVIPPPPLLDIRQKYTGIFSNQCETCDVSYTAKAINDLVVGSHVDGTREHQITTVCPNGHTNSFTFRWHHRQAKPRMITEEELKKQ